MAPSKPKSKAPPPTVKKTTPKTIRKISPPEKRASKKKATPAPSHVPSQKEGKLEKPIFHRKQICCVGNIRTFDNNDNGTAIPYEKIEKWIRVHGGVLVKEVTDDTTHLICTVRDFLRAIRLSQDGNAAIDKIANQIIRAQRLGKRRCPIVIYDWLEDSLLKNPKRMLPEKYYSLSRIICRLEQGKPVDASFFKRWKEGEDASKDMVDNKLYHIHYDPDGFEYKIVLLRSQVADGVQKNNITEKYTVYLFESHAVPHVYMVGAKLTRKNRPASKWLTWCHPMAFYDAFKHFKHFFFEKTGVPWDMRLEPLPKQTTPLPIQEPTKKGKANTNLALAVQAPLPQIDFEDRKFKYIRPFAPRPLGFLPYGYVLPENREGYLAPPPRILEENLVGEPKFVYDDEDEVKSSANTRNGKESISMQTPTPTPVTRPTPVPVPAPEPHLRAGDSADTAIELGFDSDSEVDTDEESSSDSESGTGSDSRSRSSSPQGRRHRRFRNLSEDQSNGSETETETETDDEDEDEDMLDERNATPGPVRQQILSKATPTKQAGPKNLNMQSQTGRQQTPHVSQAQPQSQLMRGTATPTARPTPKQLVTPVTGKSRGDTAQATPTPSSRASSTNQDPFAVRPPDLSPAQRQQNANIEQWRQGAQQRQGSYVPSRQNPVQNQFNQPNMGMNMAMGGYGNNMGYGGYMNPMTMNASYGMGNVGLFNTGNSLVYVPLHGGMNYGGGMHMGMPAGMNGGFSHPGYGQPGAGVMGGMNGMNQLNNNGNTAPQQNSNNVPPKVSNKPRNGNNAIQQNVNTAPQNSNNGKANLNPKPSSGNGNGNGSINGKPNYQANAYAVQQPSSGAHSNMTGFMNMPQYINNGHQLPINGNPNFNSTPNNNNSNVNGNMYAVQQPYPSNYANMPSFYNGPQDFNNVPQQNINGTPQNANNPPQNSSSANLYPSSSFNNGAGTINGNTNSNTNAVQQPHQDAYANMMNFGNPQPGWK